MIFGIDTARKLITGNNSEPQTKSNQNHEGTIPQWPTQEARNEALQHLRNKDPLRSLDGPQDANLEVHGPKTPEDTYLKVDTDLALKQVRDQNKRNNAA